jgi:hypothetical protein
LSVAERSGADLDRVRRCLTMEVGWYGGSTFML